MSNLRSSLTRAFQAADIRPTTQRYAVLEFLAAKPVHATAEDIFRAVNRSDPRASRATVYNSLRSLAGAGLVREVAPSGGAARFESALAERHHHFLCDHCGVLEDVPWFDLPGGPPPAMPGGQHVLGYQIVFHGTCARCGVTVSGGR